MKIKDTELICDGEEIILSCGIYSNGRLAIQSFSKELGEPYAVLTVNIPEYELQDGEIIVKTWNENENFSKAVFKTGLFINTGKKVSTGFVEAEVWELAPGVKIR